MAVFATLDLWELLHSTGSLGIAFVCGMLIGAERQYRQRTAGLRTNVLVATGAAAFVDLGMRLTGKPGAVQIVAYVVSGVGFLGAGAIMKEGMNVKGLNTAATLWSSAAVGAFSGAGLFAEAVLLTGFILAGNTFLRPIVNFINRIPIDEQATEATYEVRVMARASDLGRARELLVNELEAQNYPVREVEVEERGDDAVEIVATLVSTAINPIEIDGVVARLKRAEFIGEATWTLRTTD
jgi:putative Mg2+ transporter-C (MgtC) family protein